MLTFKIFLILNDDVLLKKNLVQSDLFKSVVSFYDLDIHNLRIQSFWFTINLDYVEKIIFAIKRT